MRPYQELLDGLQSEFRRIDSQMALLSEIDRAILDMDTPLGKVLSGIGRYLKRVLLADAVAFLFPIQYSKFIAIGGKIDKELIAFIDSISDKIISIQPDGKLYVEESVFGRPHSFAFTPVTVSGELFVTIVTVCTNENERHRIDTDTLPYLKRVSCQIGIMVERYIAERRARLESKLVDVFFNNKLRPTACWEQIVEHVVAFLPDWPPLRLQPSPKVQLLSYNEGDRHLRIIATQGEEMPGVDVLVDSSVCGMLVQDRSLKYLCVDPHEYPNRYKGFLITGRGEIPRSELAVPILNDDEIIGILNLEHPKPCIFQRQHIIAIRQACIFLAPFLAALRDRFERQRSKELGVLYTMSHLLRRTARVYKHLIGQPTLDIRLSLELLEKGPLLDVPEGLALINEVRAQVDLIAQSSERFCQALPGAIKFESTKVKNAIQIGLSGIEQRILAEENIFITVDIDSQVDTVYASGLLQEHIYNLVNNSIQSVRMAIVNGNIKKGDIHVQVTRKQILDRNYQQTASCQIVFRIDDNGMGAPLEVESRIGMPGFTTKQEHGTGYGLFAAREYSQSLGGNLWIYNRPGKGFTVEFVLEEFDQTKHGERSAKS